MGKVVSIVDLQKTYQIDDVELGKSMTRFLLSKKTHISNKSKISVVINNKYDASTQKFTHDEETVIVNDYITSKIAYDLAEIEMVKHFQRVFAPIIKACDNIDDLYQIKNELTFAIPPCDLKAVIFQSIINKIQSLLTAQQEYGL